MADSAVSVSVLFQYSCSSVLLTPSLFVGHITIESGAVLKPNICFVVTENNFVFNHNEIAFCLVSNLPGSHPKEARG